MDMAASDEFSEYYTELIQGTYDCVDRIVLNAFFPVGQTAGGVRSWWRWLHGDDLTLDDEHLREMRPKSFRADGRRCHADPKGPGQNRRIARKESNQIYLRKERIRL